MNDQLCFQISCSCKRSCKSARCSCKKAGLKCTRMCKNCNGESCENSSSKSFSTIYNLDNDLPGEMDEYVSIETENSHEIDESNNNEDEHSDEDEDFY